MGASESLLARQQQQRPQWADEITTVSDGRRDAADEDPLLRRIRSLTIAPPLLSSQPAAGSETETSFTDILVRKPSGSSSAASGNLSPNLMFELFAMYREWQEEMAKEISGRQVEVGELKGRLTEVISNCDALCKRITAEGPESLRRSVEPFTTGILGTGGGSPDPKDQP